MLTPNEHAAIAIVHAHRELRRSIRVLDEFDGRLQLVEGLMPDVDLAAVDLADVARLIPEIIRAVRSQRVAMISMVDALTSLAPMLCESCGLNDKSE